MRALVLLLVCLLFFQGLKALDPPTVRCITVQDNGDVDITWFPPFDPLSEFVSYEVYGANNIAGPYTLLATLTTFSPGFYTEVGANVPTAGTRYYYIITNFNDGTPKQSLPSDTITPMILNLTKYQDDFAGILTWNPIHTPNKIPSNKDYEIFRKLTWKGAWISIGTTSYGTETFNDSVSRCKQGIEYRIEMQDNIACTSISSLAVDTLFDNIAPPIPDLDSVSIDNVNGKMLLSWQSNPDADVVRYVVLRGTDSIGETVDRFDTYFEDDDPAADPFTGSISYSVAAVDSCGNKSAAGIYHHTINLQTTNNLCARSVTLDWTAYRGWNVVNGYTVFYRVDGGDFQLLGTTNANDRTFVHEGIDASKIYCYVIVGSGAGSKGISTSTSNLQCVAFPALEYPAHQYLNRAVVTEDNKVFLSCILDNTLSEAAVTYYSISRGMTPEGPFIELDTFNFDRFVGYFEYTDSTSFPDKFAYYYVVDAIDNCDQVLRRSNVARTIHLDVSPDKGAFQNEVRWTEYTDWKEYGNGVRRYYLYRGLNGVFDSIPFASTPADIYSFDDILNDLHQSGSEFCYYVEAVELDGNQFGRIDTSRSNVYCVTFETDIFIPNAFTPNKDARNDLFKPVTPYINPANYICDIYDRWGQKIHTIDEGSFGGWNGNDAQGNPAPQGIYIYHLMITTDEGSVINQKGTFSLLR